MIETAIAVRWLAAVRGFASKKRSAGGASDRQDAGTMHTTAMTPPPRSPRSAARTAARTGEPAARRADDPRWTAVLARDRAADGRFVYAVRTTGIFCRPSCPARRPRPGNVSFHATPAAAEAAGFRACRRCRPGQPAGGDGHAEAVARICRLLATADPAPPLRALADLAGLSAHHFHRVFRARTGLTPKAWADAGRDARVRAALAAGQTVTSAIYAAGYQSSGRFYARADAALGMTATAFRRGGAGVAIRCAVGPCALGQVLVAAGARGICAILLGDDAAALVRELRERFPAAELGGDDPTFARLVARVVALVDAPGHAHDLPLDVRGTAFQRRVWQALRALPAGATTSYAALAARLGRPSAVRAVAGACAANTLAVAIPCHRVVRADGGLAGYRWGVARKRALLAREAELARDGAGRPPRIRARRG